VLLVLKVFKETLGYRVRLVSKGKQGLEEPLDFRDHKVCRVIKEPLELRVKLEFKVTLVSKDKRVFRVILV